MTIEDTKKQKFQCIDCISKCPVCGSEKARMTKNYYYCKECKTRWPI